MRARLQRLPVAGHDIPVYERAVGLRHLAAGDARCLQGIVDIDAANQQQRSQDHSDKRLHATPPVTADNAGRGGWFPASPTRVVSFALRFSRGSNVCIQAKIPAGWTYVTLENGR